MSFMNTLPSELKQKIFLNIGPISLSKTILVCKEFNQLIKDEYFMKQYKYAKLINYMITQNKNKSEHWMFYAIDIQCIDMIEHYIDHPDHHKLVASIILQRAINKNHIKAVKSLLKSDNNLLIAPDILYKLAHDNNIELVELLINHFCETLSNTVEYNCNKQHIRIHSKTSLLNSAIKGAIDGNHYYYLLSYLKNKKRQLTKKRKRN